MEGFVEDYLLYLESLVGGNKEYEDYSRVMDILFRREFYSPIDRDKNRVAYGLLLRDRYEYLAGLPEGALDILGPARVLEVLIALAEDIDNNIMRDADHPDRVTEWFWTMMENAGLERYSDYAWDYDSAKEVEHIVDILLDHKYASNCRGGLFPIRENDVDMRQIELWYQAQIYFMDKV